MKLTVAAALVLAATPATVFSQPVRCHDCGHVAPYFRGEGGFIGTVADGTEVVTFVSVCGSITVTGKVVVEGPTVAQLFNHGNGLACDQDGGSLEIAGFRDGGWYWVTDDRSSAVANLVSSDVLDNQTVDITNAGDGVEMTMARGAVFLKENASGRVGILPNILPEPPVDPPELCGPRRGPSWPHPYDRQMASHCMLGGGRTKIRLIGPGAFNSRTVITTGTVTRPTTGVITVNADLWVDESGSYSTDTSDGGGPSEASTRKGWVGKTAEGQSDHDANWLSATFEAGIVASGATSVSNAAAMVSIAGGTFDGDSEADNGSGSTPAGQATIVIGASEDYCPATGQQHTATIAITATPGANAIQPPVATGRSAGLGSSEARAHVAAVTQLKVVCGT